MSQTAYKFLPWEQTLLNVDEEFTKQVYSTIRSNGDDITSSCSRYFVAVHSWYQIMVKEDFYERLSQLRSSPQADFAILLFNVYILSQMYQPVPRPKADILQLYRTAKSMHFLLVSRGRASMDLVQAGLLIALYEHSQALHNATFQTIGICARMGYTLGFHQSLSPNGPPRGQYNNANETQRLVWWAIIILERYSFTVSLLDVPLHPPRSRHK